MTVTVGADSADEDSDEDAVADALVGAAGRLSDRDLGDRSNAPPPPSSLFGASASGSDSETETDSNSDSDEDEAEVEHVSDIEEAVLEQVGEEDDLGADETLPFEFESASDESDADASDGEAEGTADESGLPRATTRTKKRRRVDSDSTTAATGAGLLLDGDDDNDSRATSRAGSHDELTLGPSDESMFIARAVAPALSPPPPPPASDAFLSMSTSTPARPTGGPAAPTPPLSFPDIGRATDDNHDDGDGEEDSIYGAGDEPEEGEVADHPTPPVVGGATTATLPYEISAALSALRAASGISSAPAVDSSSSPSVILPDNNSPVVVFDDALKSDRQPVTFSTAPPALSSGAPVPKASYERKRVDLGSLEQTPPGAPAAKRFKLSYKPSPLSSKPSTETPPLPVVAVATAAPTARAVYVRRSERSEGGTPGPESAPVKAVYQRRADALVAMSLNQTTAPNGKKNGKLRGALPLSREEKAERLPAKFYASFGEFPTPDAAKVPAIYATPKHTVLPARNLAPPNEAALHGFWPGPPSRKQASSKAIFPAPLVQLNEADDDRPRVEVFIDNSNVLYSFLNWVRSRSDAKVTSLKAPGKDAAGNPKTVKTVTVAGKKVKLDYRVLFAVLERGRKVERRVIAGSSTLWQSLEPAVEWGYEVSLLQRVPRAENSKMSAAHISAAANQLAAQSNGNKKRGGKGPQNAEIVVPQPVQGSSQVKHYKEQAVDELVHLKILQSLLDFNPPPLPLPSRAPTPDPVDPVAAAAAAPASTAPTAPTAPTATETEPSAPKAARFQPAAAFVAPAVPAASEASEPAPRFLPAGSKPPPQPRANNNNNKKTTPALRIVPRTPARNRPVLVIGTGDANSSEYNPGGFLGCVRRALDRGWDVEIAAFTSGISSLWTGEQVRRAALTVQKWTLS